MCKSKGGGDWGLIAYLQEMYLFGIVVPFPKKNMTSSKLRAANAGLIVICLYLNNTINPCTRNDNADEQVDNACYFDHGPSYLHAIIIFL